MVARVVAPVIGFSKAVCASRDSQAAARPTVPPQGPSARSCGIARVPHPLPRHPQCKAPPPEPKVPPRRDTRCRPPAMRPKRPAPRTKARLLICDARGLGPVPENCAVATEEVAAGKEPPQGFEPWTYALRKHRSTAELRWHASQAPRRRVRRDPKYRHPARSFPPSPPPFRTVLAVRQRFPAVRADPPPFGEGLGGIGASGTGGAARLTHSGGASSRRGDLGVQVPPSA